MERLRSMTLVACGAHAHGSCCWLDIRVGHRGVIRSATSAYLSISQMEGSSRERCKCDLHHHHSCGRGATRVLRKFLPVAQCDSEITNDQTNFVPEPLRIRAADRNQLRIISISRAGNAERRTFQPQIRAAQQEGKIQPPRMQGAEPQPSYR